MSRPHITAVNAHRHRTVRQGEFRNRFQGGETTGLAFVSQLLLDTLGHGLEVLPHGFMIGGLSPYGENTRRGVQAANDGIVGVYDGFLTMRDQFHWARILSFVT